MLRRHSIARNEFVRCAPQRTSFAKNSIGGMTLLEVILAIAVAGFVLTAAVSLLVSVSSIWSERSERNFFADHVDGVAEFLNATLTSSGFEGATDSGNGNTTEAASGDDPICWARPPGFANYTEPLLNFGMTEAPPILVSPDNAPNLGINAFLYFDADEGLSLLWHSILQEEVEDTNDLQRTLISPLVKKMTYIYWDERFETWEEEDSPQEGEGADQYILPRFIKLLFEYEGETKERTLTIPVSSKDALIF